MNLQYLRTAIENMLVEVKYRPHSDWQYDYGAFMAVWLPAVPGASTGLYGQRVIRIYPKPQSTAIADLGGKICAALQELGKTAGQDYSNVEGLAIIEVMPE
jgi:hypothetical protein